MPTNYHRTVPRYTLPNNLIIESRLRLIWLESMVSISMVSLSVSV